jgi:hypothetical protein
MNLMKLLLVTAFGISASVHAMMTEDNVQTYLNHLITFEVAKGTQANLEAASKAADTVVRAYENYARCGLGLIPGDNCGERHAELCRAIALLHSHSFDISVKTKFLTDALPVEPKK